MTQKHLLIVDDEPKFAAFVEKVAARIGYNVKVTTHGRDFKKAYHRRKPDIIIVDMVMPEIDGNELILWLVDQGCSADVVIITGYHPDYAINARLLAEFKGLRSVTTLSKPISTERLREVLGGPDTDHPGDESIA